MQKKEKRGLSTVIVTLILILVSLVAVGIVWLVVRNIIQTGTEGIGLSQFSLSAKILDVAIDNSSNNVSLSVKRNAGEGELEGISFVFSSLENNEVITRNVSLKELEQMTFKFHLSMNVSDLKSVSIIPLIKQDGKEIPGIALDKYNLGNSKNYFPSQTSCTPTSNPCGTSVCGNVANGTCGQVNCPPGCGTGYNCIGGSCVLNTSGVLCQPNTYYIDFVSGSDSNNGTCSNSAWKHAPGDSNAIGVPASTTITAGKTILFKGGVSYLGNITVSSSRYNSGTLGNPIIFRSGDRNIPAWGSGRAVIDGRNIMGKGFYIIGGLSFITIDGFEIMNMTNQANSAGIFVEWGTSSNLYISNNLIHHIYGAPGSSGYGIETSGLNKNFIIEFNEIYFVEEKAIELYATSNTTVRYNYLHQTNDHNMVVSGANNSIYGNLLTQAGYDWDGGGAFVPAYSFKVDSGSTPGYDYADYNNIYNNIIWDTTTGLGILNGKYNNFSNNVVYSVGFDDLKDASGGNEGFTLYNDGTSTNSVTGNKITNNIFYYITLWSIGYGAIYPIGFSFRNQTTVTNNEVRNNLFYYNSSCIDFVRFSDSGTGYPYTYHNLSWFEGASGFAKVGTGNIASGNIVAEPNFVGGVREYFNYFMIPTWFDAQGHPNQNGFKLTASSPARDTGLALSTPFNIDADGITRPQGAGWDIGAYEYV